jgi:hypothetical protein
MWVLLPVQSTLLWATLVENEFFAMQEHKAAHTMLQGVMNSFRTTIGGEKNPYSYRIIVKSRDKHQQTEGEGGHHQPHHQQQHSRAEHVGLQSQGGQGGSEDDDQLLRPLAASVVAVGDTEDEVREHWQCLEEQVTQQLCLFDQSLRSEERELRRFLNTKLAGLALKQREQQRKEKDDLILLANGVRPNQEGLSRDKHYRNLHRASKVLQASKQAPWHHHFAELARHEELTLCTLFMLTQCAHTLTHASRATCRLSMRAAPTIRAQRPPVCVGKARVLLRWRHKAHHPLGRGFLAGAHRRRQQFRDLPGHRRQ